MTFSYNNWCLMKRSGILEEFPVDFHSATFQPVTATTRTKWRGLDAIDRLQHHIERTLAQYSEDGMSCMRQTQLFLVSNESHSNGMNSNATNRGIGTVALVFSVGLVLGVFIARFYVRLPCMRRKRYVSVKNKEDIRMKDAAGEEESTGETPTNLVDAKGEIELL